MAETFNPIISHLYSGQGGVSREITKYNNATISEINVVDNGVTTKYDFGGKYVEKMYSGYRVWNQLIQNGNFADTSVWSVETGTTFTVSDNVGSVTSTSASEWDTPTGISTALTTIAGHKYAFSVKLKSSDVSKVRMRGMYNGGLAITFDITSSWRTYTYIGSTSLNGNVLYVFPIEVGTIDIADVNVFDLTLIYGVGNEPSVYSQFVHDYGDEYHPYNAGTNFSLATKLFNTIKQPLDSIKFYGNTMRWCQLVQNGNFDGTTGWGSGSGSISASDNIVTLLATAQNGQAYYDVSGLITGHKYLVVASLKLTTGTTDVRLIGNIGSAVSAYTASNINWQMLSVICTATGATGSIIIRDGRSSDWDAVQIKNVQLFDLTYIFGAGNEPTTVSDFTRRLKKLYYPFTNGEILSIEKASEYLYGLNIWDEEWEVGGYSSAYGTKDASTNKFRSKNPIRVLPFTDYYATIGQEDYGYITLFYYDAEYNYISYYSVIPQGSGSFTTPANACFATFQIVKEGWNNQYHNDICISLSNASTNGTYEAYKGEQKMQLDSFNVWDEEWEVGEIISSGEVVSGTRVVSKNFISVLPSTAYCFVKTNATNTTDIRPFFYDANKNFISSGSWSYASSVQTTPSNCVFIKFHTALGYGTTYNNDICINLSDPSRNGIYVPYRRYVELNGINDVIDTVTVEKNVTLPFGLVDLGTLDYHLITATETRDAFYATVDNFRGVLSSSEVPNIIAKNFTPVSYSSTWIPWTISVFGDNYNNLAISIPHNMFTEKTLKAYLKAFYLYYELADHPLNDTPILAGSYMRKIDKVDMGSLTWLYDSTTETFRVDRFIGKTNGAQMLCSAYSVTTVLYPTSTNLPDKILGNKNYWTQTNIWVKDSSYTDATTFTNAVKGQYIYYEVPTPIETALTAQECAEILNGAFTKSKYSTLLTDNDNGQIDQTVDVGMWEQR